MVLNATNTKGTNRNITVGIGGTDVNGEAEDHARVEATVNEEDAEPVCRRR